MASRTVSGKPESAGFTLIELLVVLAIIASLLAIVAPRYYQSTEIARETALKANLQTLREAIDHFHGDRGQYPQSLEALVEARYLRTIPVDPISGSASTWRLVAPPTNAAQAPQAAGPAPVSAGVYDVRSGAEGATRDGEPFENL